MKHTFILIILFSFTLGQAVNHKCGIISETDLTLQRDSQNWGYGYDSLLVDLNRWEKAHM